MSLEVLIRPVAKHDIKDAAAYINKHNNKASYEFVDTLQKIISNLAVFPDMGKLSGENIGIFKFLVSDYNYWILYTFSNTQLEVLRIVHTSRETGFKS